MNKRESEYLYMCMRIISEVMDNDGCDISEIYENEERRIADAELTKEDVDVVVNMLVEFGLLHCDMRLRMEE